MSSIAQRIRDLRQSAGLNQSQFAKAIGVSQGSVSKWERGVERPRADVLLAMAAAFEREAADLFLPDDHPLTPSSVWLMGTIEPGTFRESALWNKAEWQLQEFPSINSFECEMSAYLVSGRSLQPLFLEDTIVYVAPAEAIKNEIVVSDIFLICRKVGDLYENGLWKVAFEPETPGGFFENLAKDVQPARLMPGGSGSAFNVVGIVVASMRYEAAYHRLASARAQNFFDGLE